MRLFDLHCDTLSECYNKNLSLYKNSLHIDIERGKKYTQWVQCFAVFIPDEYRGKQAVDYFNLNYSKLNEMITNSKGKIEQLFSNELLQKTDKNVKLECIAMLTVEGGAAASGTTEGINHLWNCGVKMMTLTWNGSNEIGSGCFSKDTFGLTDFGKTAIKEMNRLGMVIDVSHASDKLFADVEEFSSKPFVASHSNSRAVCNHLRNLTDEQFNIIKNRGGIVGINLYPLFINGKDDVTIDKITEHIDHFLCLGGKNTIAMGTDFDGAAMPSDLNGIEKLYKLAEHLKNKNYSDDLIDAIFYKNANDFFKRNL